MRNYVHKTKNVAPASDGNLFETDDGISSEDKDCIEDELSWYESEPLSDSNSLTDNPCRTQERLMLCRTQTAKQIKVIQNLKMKMVLLVKKFKETMGICGGRTKHCQKNTKAKYCHRHTRSKE